MSASPFATPAILPALQTTALRMAEYGRLPDAAVRWGIRLLCKQRLQSDDPGDAGGRAWANDVFAAQMRQSPIAPVPHLANEQHYEVPAEFYDLVLGAHRKYSCCYFPDRATTLDGAEAAALKITCERAELADGMRILELGCGWGSLTLWMAEKYPHSQITAVSNSRSQRRFIMDRALARGLGNLQVITADMNDFAAPGRYERVVSVEMFEHMRNYERLLGRIAGWLLPGGKLFIHIFCHRAVPYEFESEGAGNWMGRYFFSGGIMPSDELLLRFQNDLAVTNQWRWSGSHYQRTAEAWLANLDQRRDAALVVLGSIYGADQAELWLGRWRIFFMACAELFGYRGGSEWGVCHYVLQHRG